MYGDWGGEEHTGYSLVHVVQIVRRGVFADDTETSTGVWRSRSLS